VTFHLLLSAGKGSVPSFAKSWTWQGCQAAYKEALLTCFIYQLLSRTVTCCRHISLQDSEAISYMIYTTRSTKAIRIALSLSSWTRRVVDRMWQR